EGFAEMRAKRDPGRRMKGETNPFRVMVRTLLNGHIITERTRGFYAGFLDMDELAAEGDVMPGEAIAEEGIAYLKEINFRERAQRGAAALMAAN
ncbi:MAG: hypothetical protein ACREEH_00085, partial [Caulobacteraceae bacterium]